MDILELMNACNGEIRILPARYGSGFHCVALMVERYDDEFWQRFEDFNGGDIDYFEARAWFESVQNMRSENFAYCWGKSPEEALSAAIAKLTENRNERTD